MVGLVAVIATSKGKGEGWGFRLLRSARARSQRGFRVTVAGKSPFLRKVLEHHSLRAVHRVCPRGTQSSRAWGPKAFALLRRPGEPCSLTIFMAEAPAGPSNPPKKGAPGSSWALLSPCPAHPSPCMCARMCRPVSLSVCLSVCLCVCLYVCM